MAFDCYQTSTINSDSTLTYNGCQVDITNGKIIILISVILLIDIHYAGAMNMSTGVFTAQEAGTYRDTLLWFRNCER